MRFIILCFFCLITSQGFARQTDTLLNNQPAVNTNVQFVPPMNVIDSVAAAMAARQRYVADSLATLYVRMPDSARVNQFVLDIIKKEFYKGYGFLDIKLKQQSIVREGTPRPMRAQWTIGIIIVLLLYAGILNLVMNKDVEIVFRSFYNKRSNQMGKEESLFNSRAFIALFVLFGLTSGLFIYQVSAAYDKYYSISGFQLFLSLSAIIAVLFALKLLVLQCIGFVFNVNKVVGEYISILYLTYFNIAFVFLPLTLCFCLLSAQLAPYILTVAAILIVIIFVWQYLRSSVNIISNFRFHKFYLFIYLCALEICPILILIKALNI